MEKLISCCGINCAKCDARIATISNDERLKKEIAEKWKTEYNVPEITSEMINCTGCRMEGTKIGHWNECKIRNCATAKGFSTCGECKDIETCELMSGILKNVPDALENLRRLN